MSLRKIFFILFVPALLGIMASCELINPEESIPSYIHIDSLSVNTASNPEYGSSSSKITDAWIYIDDNIAGAFELPATIPLLFSGKHKVTIKAGIKVNGISGTRAVYPFYETYTASVNLVPDSMITINPVLNYNSYTVFEWKESFEDGGISLDPTAFSDTTIDKTSDPSKVFEGSFSGIIHLDASHDFFQCKCLDSYTLPTNDDPVFLEMNYKTNNEITVGLYANGSSQTERLDMLVLNKTDQWKKIYINLKSAINRTSVLSPTFQVFFEIQKNSDVSEAEILFDNIKLLHN
jgi:hypothetical protein